MIFVCNSKWLICIFIFVETNRSYILKFGNIKLYCISSFIGRRSRSVLLDGSRSLGFSRKGKIGIIAKFHRTDLVI